MSDSNFHIYPSHTDFIPQSRHQFLKEQLHLSHHFRNSAPSRLQHFDDVSVDDISATSQTTERSNSLTGLFQRGDFQCQGSIDEQLFQQVCKFPHSMPSPSSSLSDSNGSIPPSPLDPVHMRKNFCADANNNDDSDAHDDCDTLSQTSSTSLEGSDERRSCFESNGAKARTHAFVADTQGSDWRHLIRRDTFKLNKLTLDDINLQTDDSTNPQRYAVDEISHEASQEVILDNDDVESISSFSSDETFVSDNVLEDRPQTVYRSLSDSRVHQSCRKEITEDKRKRRKSVHFADTSGYELEIHIPISHSDEYKVPPRLMEALGKIRAESEGKSDNTLHHDKGGYNTLLRHFSLVLNFQQPFLEATFQSRVNRQHVCLESISILPDSLSFTGVIRVANLDFEKKVVVRVTANNWKTYKDIPSCYVSSLSGCEQDQFSFHVVAPDTILATGKIELAVCFALPRSKREFWDNNYGQNYVIKCIEHRGSYCDDGMMT